MTNISLLNALIEEERPMLLCLQLSRPMYNSLLRQWSQISQTNPFWATLGFQGWLREQLRDVAFPDVSRRELQSERESHDG